MHNSPKKPWAVASALAFLLLPLVGTGCGVSPSPRTIDESMAAAHVEDDEEILFEGICDGSAAVQIEAGAILVAYDELNTLFAFKTSGGRPTARRDLAPMLDLEAADEADLEGAAAAGQRVWWIGSHGLDGDGEAAPNRRILFATNVPSASLEDLKIERQSVDLLPILLASAEVAGILTPEVRERLPKEGGVNIEGLASGPEGGLVLGFRSPLSAADGMSGDALVVRLRPQGDSFVVDRLQRLDLGGRGVRDLVNDGDGYAIVAGPVGRGDPFALYSWDGEGVSSKLVDLEPGLNAEAVLDMGDHYLVLSDDGKVTRDDEEADDGDRKCDKIRKKNTRGENHPGVFFRTQRVPKT